MNTETVKQHATVREGYQILLRADAELLIPVDKPKMRGFYLKMADTCMKWAEEIYGEELKREFAELETIRERSQFSTQRYRLRIRCPWEEGIHAAFLCESTLTGQWKEPQKSYHRISHVWNTEEESILPFSQILKSFGLRISKQMLPFPPDGMYPEGEEMVFFRNVTDQTPFLEKRLPRNLKEGVEKSSEGR
ncbi:MAG: hypothetical protein IKA05_06965 [Clostridia bacterium]|nr:hypothetical protein [Clostridia bacterium]